MVGEVGEVPVYSDGDLALLDYAASSNFHPAPDKHIRGGIDIRQYQRRRTRPDRSIT